VTSLALPTLTGSACTLRALRPADAMAIAVAANHADVVHNLYDGFPHPYTQAHADLWCSTQHREPPFGHVFAITLNDIAIGCTGVAPMAGHHACNAEVGYWIGRDFWGMGIAADALRLATHWAWRELPAVQRLVAPIFAGCCEEGRLHLGSPATAQPFESRPGHRRHAVRRVPAVKQAPR
jgi:[ribosomal protein S5]-alanine N-acetyltransferase